MNKKGTYTKLVVVFFSIIMIMSAIGISALEDIATEKSAPLLEEKVEDTPFEDNTKTPQKHGTRVSSPRTVLAEMFTNWGCPKCPYGDNSLNELMDVYNSSQLVMIEYHYRYPSSSDPFNNYNLPDHKERRDYYSVNSVPRLYVDGPPVLWKGSGSVADTYSRWKNAIDTELTELSNMTIALEGYLDLILMNGTINATIEITDNLPVGNLTVRFAVVEDNKYLAGGSNGEVRWRYVMRDMLANESLPLLTVGQSYQVSRLFPIDPIFNIDSISLVVFVQNDDDKDVLQAALFDFIPQEILVVDDDESENPLGYEDDYHELLSQMEYAYDGWTLNERGSPTSDDLVKYKAVIWITAETSISTLSTIDQTAISDYLDNGRGSLFLTGENVGADIGSTTFYHDYLHSNFIADDTNEENISGVNNDPISDPFFGTTIPIRSGYSPSEISPIGPATTVFQYSPSGDTGGIKAVHDSNSKVVYFAFMYFEGSDSDSNKMILMERILNWMMSLTSTIPLSEGWNLISIPLIQPDTSLSTVLDSIEGEYDRIQRYNSSDPFDPWEHHHISKPSEMNDLSDLNHEIAFWVHITTPGGTLLKCNGTQPTENQTIGLHIGWNLVGYPSLIDRKRDLALNNINFGTDVGSVWTYDVASQQWKELGLSDNFELGRGYWIHSTVEKMWDVPL